MAESRTWYEHNGVPISWRERVRIEEQHKFCSTCGILMTYRESKTRYDTSNGRRIVEYTLMCSDYSSIDRFVYGISSHDITNLVQHRYEEEED